LTKRIGQSLRECREVQGGEDDLVDEVHASERSKTVLVCRVVAWRERTAALALTLIS
jgi:hypothetical protein